MQICQDLEHALNAVADSRKVVLFMNFSNQEVLRTITAVAPGNLIQFRK